MTDDFSSGNVKDMQVIVDFVMKIPMILKLSESRCCQCFSLSISIFYWIRIWRKPISKIVFLMIPLLMMFNCKLGPLLRIFSITFVLSVLSSHSCFSFCVDQMLSRGFLPHSGNSSKSNINDCTCFN